MNWFIKTVYSQVVDQASALANYLQTLGASPDIIQFITSQDKNTAQILTNEVRKDVPRERKGTNIVNWYKKAQQGLFFYPWAEKPEQISQNILPSGVDPETGENIYICHQCGKYILESDANWYREREQRGEKLQLPSYDSEQVTAGITEIAQYLGSFLPQLDQYIKEQNLESKRNETYDYGYIASLQKWEIQVPQLPNIVNKYPALGDICAYKGGSGWWKKNICNLIKMPSTEINGEKLNDLREIINNLSDIIEEYNQYSGKNFEIDYNVPVCDECYEEFDKCEICDKVISPDENKYETRWNDSKYICEECMEDDRTEICSECGKADYRENMFYREGIGYICDDCYKVFSSKEMDWAEEAVANLNIPIGKNLPINKNTLEIAYKFLEWYANKYGHETSLLNDNEWQKFNHLAKKAGLPENAVNYIEYLRKMDSSLDEYLSDIKNNISAQEYIQSQYPNLSRYRDLPFDIDVEKNYNETLPGFTLTITPSKEFFNYAKTKYPDMKDIWKKMKQTPHHPGVLAYARCSYDGGNTIVINNLQRDADFDNYMQQAYNPKTEQEETAKWFDNMTKNWDVFLLDVVRAMAMSNNISAYLTTYDQQKRKWGNLPIHKAKKTYKKIPEQMGFQLQETNEPALVEEGNYGEEMYQVAKDKMNWYKKAQKCWYDKAKERDIEISDEVKDHLDRISGLGKYKPPQETKEHREKRRKDRKTDCEPMHSMDIHCDGENDGW